MAIIFQNKLFTNSQSQNKYGFFLDSALKYNLDNYIIKGIKNKHDGIVLITGLEGTGKSTLAKQLAAYCGSHFNKTLDLDNIVFDGKDLMDRIDAASPGTPIIFDEAIMDMASQDASTDMQKILIKKFTLIRKKRLLIFIVIPSFFMLRKYFAIFRTRVMINCFCPDGVSRGAFKAYSFGRKKKLYIYGWKEMNMGSVPPSFIGRFVDTTGYFMDEDAYELKKDIAIKKLTEDDKQTPKEKLVEEMNDFKDKLKLELSSYKEKTKEKIEVWKVKQMEQVRLHKLKAVEKFENKLQLSENNYRKTLAFLFKIMNEHYKLQYGKEISVKEFVTILNVQKVFSASELELKKNLKYGQEILELTQSPL